jgi:hypothetical protein
MSASPKGVGAINKVFEGDHINWDQADRRSKLPDDWREFEINVPDFIRNTEAIGKFKHKVKLAITGGMDLRVASPNSLAFLLAVSAKDQGVRAASFVMKFNKRMELKGIERVEILVPDDAKALETFEPGKARPN